MKTKIERVKTSLEIEEDIDIQIKGWILQRIGWILMLAFLLLAGLGFFGDGPLSEETLTEGSAALSYEKYVRRENDTEFEITAPARDGKVRVTRRRHLPVYSVAFPHHGQAEFVGSDDLRPRTPLNHQRGNAAGACWPRLLPDRRIYPDCNPRQHRPCVLPVEGNFPIFGKVTEGLPLIIVNEGKPLLKRMKKSKVSEEDVLEAARMAFGLEKLKDIKYAILEKGGDITIVPFRPLPR